MAVHFFTSRYGGGSQAPFATNNLALHVGDNVNAVLANRNFLQEQFGTICFMNQSHGSTVALVEEKTLGEPNCDALVTQVAGIYLAVLTADCIPLLMWDENATCVAAVHVGRAGLQNGIAVKTVEVMKALGSLNISAALGPSICGSCYEVGEDVFEEVVALHPSAASRTLKGTPALDLPGALIDQIEKLGVKSARARDCTAESSALYSYRRDGVTGRSAGVIAL